MLRFFAFPLLRTGLLDLMGGGVPAENHVAPWGICEPGLETGIFSGLGSCVCQRGVGKLWLTMIGRLGLALVILAIVQ